MKLSLRRILKEQREFDIKLTVDELEAILDIIENEVELEINEIPVELRPHVKTFLDKLHKIYYGQVKQDVEEPEGLDL